MHECSQSEFSFGFFLGPLPGLYNAHEKGVSGMGACPNAIPGSVQMCAYHHPTATTPLEATVSIPVLSLRVAAPE